MLYALMDSSDVIDAEHLDAALALWAYAEHSARWLFSSHELEAQRETADGLAKFILSGGDAGRTRTEISVDYFKRNKSAAQISAELTPLVHDGVVIETKDETVPRPVTCYIHRTLRINEFTNYAAQDPDPVTNDYEFTNSEKDRDDGSVRKFVDSSSNETRHDLQSSFNSLIRTPETKNVPGDVTQETRGYTDRVQHAPHTNGHSPHPPPRRPGCVCATQPTPCHWCTLAASKRGAGL